MLSKLPLIRLLLLLLVVPALVTSCESPTSTVEQKLDSTSVGKNDRAVFVLNEGQYASNDGSLDAIIIRANGRDTVVDHNVLTGLGIGNAVHVFGAYAYVIDNASNQIIKLSCDSLRKLGTLSFGMDSPNDIALIAPDKAIVTLLYTAHAAIVDLATMRIVDSVELGEGSNSAAVLGNKAFITTGTYGGGSHVQVYDLGQSRVTSTIALLAGAGPIIADSAHNQVIVGSVGTYDTTTGRVYWLNPSTEEITDSANTTSTFASLAFVASGAKSFALDGGSVARLDEVGHTIQSLGLTGNFYNGAYDAESDQLYLGHNDFSGNAGVFEVYGATDLKRHWSEAAGIAPAHFAFYH
jgi:hypothetical protein